MNNKNNKNNKNNYKNPQPNFFVTLLGKLWYRYLLFAKYPRIHVKPAVWLMKYCFYVLTISIFFILILSYTNNIEIYKFFLIDLDLDIINQQTSLIMPIGSPTLFDHFALFSFESLLSFFDSCIDEGYLFHIYQFDDPIVIKDDMLRELLCLKYFFEVDDSYNIYRQEGIFYWMRVAIKHLISFSCYSYIDCSDIPYSQFRSWSRIPEGSYTDALGNLIDPIGAFKYFTVEELDAVLKVYGTDIDWDALFKALDTIDSADIDWVSVVQESQEKRKIN